MAERAPAVIDQHVAGGDCVPVMRANVSKIKKVSQPAFPLQRTHICTINLIMIDIHDEGLDKAGTVLSNLIWSCILSRMSAMLAQHHAPACCGNKKYCVLACNVSPDIIGRPTGEVQVPQHPPLVVSLHPLMPLLHSMACWTSAYCGQLAYYLYQYACCRSDLPGL